MVRFGDQEMVDSFQLLKSYCLVKLKIQVCDCSLLSSCCLESFHSSAQLYRSIQQCFHSLTLVSSLTPHQEVPAGYNTYQRQNSTSSLITTNQNLNLPQKQHDDSMG